MSAQPYSPEDTAPRLLAYLASVRPMGGCDWSDDESYARSRGLRSWAGKPVKLAGLALADRYQWTEPRRKPVALPDP
jgi:hypothetical protein